MFSTNQIDSVKNSNVIENIKLTYLYFAGAMLSAAVGSFVGMPLAASISANYWYIAIPWMLFGMFGLAMVKNIPTMGIIGLYLFSLVGGIVITPLLSHILNIPGGSQIVINSFLMTAALFGGLSLFAMSTKYDVRSYGKPFIISFFILIVFSIINMIFFQSTIIQVILQGVIFLILTFLVVYDTQNIITGQYTPIEGAITLFLDFFNMFSIILQFMGISSVKED